MTHSVSQMTDPTKNIDCSTQTALPVAPIALERYIKNAATDDANPTSDKAYINDKEDLLLKQIEELIQMNDEDGYITPLSPRKRSQESKYIT
jgi:hypothetical protein